ncbi:MAG: hypothetical protein H6626_15035 [Pseudobdellovibrionaceae bacterium]|nr:hypothetical protein [Bdellovibrionales bacterium]USN47467.1 MAG: hypothetical protein H6626_15035 [Pseudobdellovibrionaceae bacterium]
MRIALAVSSFALILVMFSPALAASDATQLSDSVAKYGHKKSMAIRVYPFKVMSGLLDFAGQKYLSDKTAITGEVQYLYNDSFVRRQLGSDSQFSSKSVEVRIDRALDGLISGDTFYVSSGLGLASVSIGSQSSDTTVSGNMVFGKVIFGNQWAGESFNFNAGLGLITVLSGNIRAQSNKDDIDVSQALYGAGIIGELGLAYMF